MSSSRIKKSLAAELGIDVQNFPCMYQAAVEFEKFMQKDEAEKRAENKRHKLAKQKAKQLAEQEAALKRKAVEEKQKQKKLQKEAKENEQQLEKQAKRFELLKKLKSKSNRKKESEHEEFSDNDDELINLVRNQYYETSSICQQASEKLKTTTAKLLSLKTKKNKDGEVLNALSHCSKNLGDGLQVIELKARISSLVVDLLEAYCASSTVSNAYVNKNHLYLGAVYRGMLQIQAFAFKINGQSNGLGESIENKEYLIKVLNFWISYLPDKRVDYTALLDHLTQLVEEGKELTQGSVVSLVSYIDLIRQDVHARLVKDGLYGRPVQSISPGLRS